jgi:hypothetical protein
MSAYIAYDIEKMYDKQGLAAAQDRYRAWFIITAIYARYKANTDTILSTDDYGACIVAE